MDGGDIMRGDVEERCIISGEGVTISGDGATWSVDGDTWSADGLDIDITGEVMLMISSSSSSIFSFIPLFLFL